MNPTTALFLSLASACAGFAALRLSLNGALKEIGLRDRRRWPHAWKIAGALLLILSALVWAAEATSPVVGWMSWLFCTLAIAPMPLIALWPFSPRIAVFLPTLLLGVLAAIASIM